MQQYNDLGTQQNQEQNESVEEECDTTDDSNDLGYFGCETGDFDEMVGPDTVDSIYRALIDEQFASSSANMEYVYSVPMHVLYESTKPDFIDLDMQVIENKHFQTTFNVNQTDTYSRFLGHILNNELVQDEEDTTEVEDADISPWFGEASRVLNGSEWE